MLASIFISTVLAAPRAPSAHALGDATQEEPPRAAMYDNHQLQSQMARLATVHADIVTMLPVGMSHQQRKIDALRIAAGERKPGRPGILIVANIDGPWVYTSGIALDHAQRLADGYATDPKIKALLDSTTVYIIPRANPDAAEARFVKPLIEQRATGHGIDNDRDARNGEDPPSDVNDDGFVTLLRIADPDGEWMPDPVDPRAMIKADRKKGQRGIWKVMPEGRDSDHDKLTGEDGEFDAVVNRNFPQGWEPFKPESGLFATDEPEARALCDFILAHKDIALVMTYGMQDNLVEKPKSVADNAPRVKLLPPEGTLESDAALYAEIGKHYKQITQNTTKGDNDDHGSFQAWCLQQRGLWTLDCALWSIPLDDASTKKDDAKKDEGKHDDAKKDEQEGKGDSASADRAAREKSKDGGASPAKSKDDDKPVPSDDAKRLRWIDANKSESWRFIPWKPFQHPDVGAVEIGGFAPFGTIEPPEAERIKIAQSQFEFVLTLGDLLPRVKVESCVAKDLFNGLWEVKAAIVNDALLPLLSASARRSLAVRPARVTIRVSSGAQLLAGKKQELVWDLPGSGGRKEFRWLVSGTAPSAIRVEIDTDHAGVLSVTPEVK
jgi:hypothetical protein